MIHFTGQGGIAAPLHFSPVAPLLPFCALGCLAADLDTAKLLESGIGEAFGRGKIYPTGNKDTAELETVPNLAHGRKAISDGAEFCTISTAANPPDDADNHSPARNRPPAKFRAEISELERKAAEVGARSAEIRAYHRKQVNWADIYKDASLEEKRAVAAFLIKSVASE